jgi:hypothetical protein
MIEMLVGMVVGIPVGCYIWGAYGEYIADWIEGRFEK